MTAPFTLYLQFAGSIVVILLGVGAVIAAAIHAVAADEAGAALRRTLTRRAVGLGVASALLLTNGIAIAMHSEAVIGTYRCACPEAP